MATSKVKHDFEPEQMVYLLHDPDQYPRWVKWISFGAGGILIYTLVCGSEESEHFENEIIPAPVVI